MKCRKCGGSAALELRRHNAAFCSPHFIEFFRKQVAEAVHRHRMFTREETIMVAVSGGKDSLALWDVLVEEVEAENLQFAVVAGLRRHGGGAVEGPFADHRPRVVGDAPHDVEAAGGARDSYGLAGEEVGAELGADSPKEVGDRGEVEQVGRQGGF